VVVTIFFIVILNCRAISMYLCQKGTIGRANH